MKRNYLIEPITSEQTHHLRHKILRPNQPLEEMKYKGDYDSDTFHFGIVSDGKVYGTVSLYKQRSPNSGNENEWRFRGMTVNDELKGKGFGRQLLMKCFETAKKNGATTVWCNARISAEGFYKKERNGNSE